MDEAIKTMIDINIRCIPEVQFIGGSSTLILGSEELASSFLDATIHKFSLRHNMRWLFPETITCRNLFNLDDDENTAWADSTELFLEKPREIFYQVMGKKICFGGDLVFVKGVTAELVEKFDNQNLDGFKERHRKYIEKMISRNKDLIIGYEEYEDEYPEFDEFGNLNEISWLRDYAMYADDFSKRNNVDVFLSLEWNKPKSHFPSSFWGLFDRIYKFERSAEKTMKAVQLR